MKSLKNSLFFGFLIWIIVFVVAIAIFPLRESNRPLFESIMPVALAACVTLLSVVYFRKVTSEPAREGIILGLTWFILNLALDRLMFSWGPMKMSIVEYLSDIGVTYLMIPIIPLGMGVVLTPHMQ